MNFNEFRDSWYKDEGGDMPLSLSIKIMKKANQPLDSIRNNMKNELYFQLVGILLVALIPMFYKISGMTLVAYYALFILLLIISFYYFLRFYGLFKKIHNYNTSIKENLYELYYEIRLHIEMYKSFSFLLMPFLFFLIGMIIIPIKIEKHASDGNVWTGSDWVYFLSLAIFITLLMIVLTNWWVGRFYGKHANKIRIILDELKD